MPGGIWLIALAVLSLQQLLYGAVLGIVQGVSEWLPISSKTQVLVASSYLMHISFQQAYAFGLFMEIGTILAAVIYFRRDVLSLLRALFGMGTPAQNRLFWFVLSVTVTTGIIAVPLYKVADSVAGVAVGAPLLIIGFVLLGDALLIRHSRLKQLQGTNTRKFQELRAKDYLLIGIMQGIAALPGVSRSGITTSTMLLLKVEPDEAFRLSFLIGIFAAIGAVAVTLATTGANLSTPLAQLGATGLAVAIAVSTVVSLLLIDFLIKVAGRSSIVYLTTALGLIALAAGALAAAYGVG